MQISNDDYYDGVTERTAAILKKMQVYIDLALQNGDAIHQERPGELVIKIRIPKEKP